MTFTQHERKRLNELANVLIPAANGCLSASEADVGGSGLNQVLATSTDVGQALRQILLKTGSAPPMEAVATLKQTDAAAFGALAEFAAGAYFLNPTVRQAIGYAGQTPRSIDPAPDYLDEGLLESVIRRGPIYRPTRQ